MTKIPVSDRQASLAGIMAGCFMFEGVEETTTLQRFARECGIPEYQAARMVHVLFGIGRPISPPKDPGGPA